MPGREVEQEGPRSAPLPPSGRRRRRLRWPEVEVTAAEGTVEVMDAEGESAEEENNPDPTMAPTGLEPPSGGRQQTIAPVVIPGGDRRRSWARGGR